MEFLYMLETIRNPVLDRFFQFITLAGQEELVFGVLCLIYWCLHKNLAYQLAFTYFSAGLSVQALKITFRIPRPWILAPDFKPVKSAVSAATGYSFPSGHTQGGTSLFFTFFLKLKHNWLRAGSLLMCILIGFSRMYLGVHTPKDVLVSIAISMFFAWIMFRFMQKYENNHSKDIAISVFLAVISAAVLIYALILLHLGRIDVSYANDCCKAAGAGIGFAIGWFAERSYIKFGTSTATRHGQFIKFIIGIVVLLVLKSGLKLVIGSSIAANTLRYFLLVLWIIVLYPLIFKRFNRNNF